MKQIINRYSLVWLLGMAMLSNGAALQAQTPGTIRPLGVVTAIDRAAKQITIKTDGGAEMAVQLLDSAAFRHVAPGEKDLKNAKEIAFTDIGVGDRILAR